MILPLVFVFSAWAVSGTVNEKPKLILQITIDQMRGDFPMRYKDRLGEDGFRYLMEKGTWYIDAHYQHANTETAVGHASLATGADPSRHGVVANDWIDQKTGEFVYNTEDERHHIIGREPKAHEGVSPHNLLSSTEEAEKMGIGSIAAIHGSPWAYDTFVPIFFACHGVPAQVIGRRVAPTDIVATLAAYLGVKPPSGSVGTVLTEVLKGK